MANSITEQDLVKRILRQFDRTVKNTKVTTRIQHLGNEVYSVNGRRVYQHQGYWCVSGDSHRFVYKKSAVGYALCITQKQLQKADEIVKLDSRVKALNIDIETYTQRKSRADEFKQDVYDARISRDSQQLLVVDGQLSKHLKSIPIA